MENLKMKDLVILFLIVSSLIQALYMRGIKREITAVKESTATSTAVIDYLITPVSGVTGFTNEVNNSLLQIQEILKK